MKIIKACVLILIAVWVAWALEHRDPAGVHASTPYDQYTTLGADDDGESAP